MRKRCGFVSIVGPTNAGKSTIINALLGTELLITSSKPQTTRKRVRAIVTREDYQIIFVDTPGLHKPLHLLGEFLIDEAKKSLKNIDCIVYVKAADEPEVKPFEREVLSFLKTLNMPKLFVLNKMDVVKKDRAKEILEDLKEELDFFDSYLMVSAKRRENIDVLEQWIAAHLPEGEFLFPADITSDITVRELAEEYIREAIIKHVHQEVPHSVAVVIEEFKERGDTTYISANIYVERDGQKAIIIGKGGQMIKKIGKVARERIEMLLGTKVYLELWVKVREDWRYKKGALAEFGYKRRD